MAIAGLISISQLGLQVATCLGPDGGDRAEALRLAFSFVEQFDKAGEGERHAIVDSQPPGTGDAHFDALLAALVETVCAGAQMVPPAWVNEPCRYLDKWWFVSGLRSLHADALVHSPISFARRSIFVTEGALSYA